MQTQEKSTTKAIAQSTILTQFLTTPKELVSEFLYRCDFQSFQSLRRVSTAFLNASTYICNYCSPLNSRAIISCDFHMEEEMKLKLAFAQENNINASIMIYAEDLITKLTALELTIEKFGQKKILLKIKNLGELANFEEFVTSNPNLPLFNSIEELNILFVVNNDLNASISRILTTVFQNPGFSNLTSLTFKEGIYDCFFTLPICTKLRTLNIKEIDSATVTMPDSYINLESLIINDIYNGSTFVVQCPLPKLTNLSISCCRGSTTTLPKLLPRLTNLIIKEISSTQVFPLPESYSVPMLETLTIQALGGRRSSGDINLSGLTFNTLRHFIIENVCGNSTITLSGSFDNLTTIAIKNISCFECIPKLEKNIITAGMIDVTLVLSGSYKNLNNFTICNNDFIEKLESIQAYSQDKN